MSDLRVSDEFLKAAQCGDDVFHRCCCELSRQWALETERRLLVGDDERVVKVEETLFEVAVARKWYDEDGEYVGLSLVDEVPRLVVGTGMGSVRENLLVELAKEHDLTAEEVHEQYKLFVRRF